jgi:hypothetical protein
MSYYSASIKCPYYAHDNVKESTITCESVLPGGTVRHHFAAGKAALTGAIRRYCAGDYESCPWFRLVSMRWEEDEK